MIGIIQLLLVVIFVGQFNSLDVDLLTPKEFLIREIVILLVILILQAMKNIGGKRLKGTINCPVCEKEIERTYYSGEHGTEEEFYHCDGCGYGYEFAYGNYVEYVNGKEFPYTYHDKEDDPVFTEIEEEIEKLKLAISTRNTNSLNVNENNLLK
jgi:predicted RNA-binding Zn-ribbon protein involved in translation (DUF1610 family)